MLDKMVEDDSYEDGSLMFEKKRRLRYDQVVKVLKRSFELDNKLEQA